jgi:hypothetical protein
MTDEDLTRMAREAGMVLRAPFTLAHLRDFTALAAAAEREACAKVCDSIHAKHIQTFGDYLGDNSYATECADAIRARGNT